MYPALPPKLIDCQFYPPGVATELFIVEGDSASNAICCVRDAGYQAVMPMRPGSDFAGWPA